MRGRLIRPFLVDIAQLDTAATAADPDGAGALTAGYDSVFRAPVLLPTVDGRGATNRVEKALLRLHAQVEITTADKLQQMPGGNSPTSQNRLVFHFAELEDLGLVDPLTGEPLLRVNDRLHAIYTLDGDLVLKIRTPPGLYFTEVQGASFGLGIHRNLCIVQLDNRERGKTI